MKSAFKYIVVINLFLNGMLFSQIYPDTSNTGIKSDIPVFFKNKLSDIEHQISGLVTGTSEIIAISPGGLPVYAVYYGKKNTMISHANYNSAIGARDIKFYKDRASDSKPVVCFVGPVHGHEVEGIVGLLNFIHIAETGKDYRNKAWSELKEKIDRCRIIIIPCGNPDGRKRCIYESFVGLPEEIMTKYGQGTKSDGSLWRWPHVKALHPMKSDVGILGAYFNDEGINIMHDEFFDPMAKETKAILDIAREEAPDLIVSLHSHGSGMPVLLQPAYVPWSVKEKVEDLAGKLKENYALFGLEHLNAGEIYKPTTENENTSFNLVSALHHVSGAISFTFESDQGTISESKKIVKPLSTHDDILDVQLVLYTQMLDYALKLIK